MLDEKDLQAIAEIVDTKVKAAIAEEHNQMMAYIDDKQRQTMAYIDDKQRQTMAYIDDKSTQTMAYIDNKHNQTMAYIESEVMPKFKLLAEGHELLLDTLAPKSRVEALEDDTAFMKNLIKDLYRRVEALEKAQ